MDVIKNYVIKQSTQYDLGDLHDIADHETSESLISENFFLTYAITQLQIKLN